MTFPGHEFSRSKCALSSFIRPGAPDRTHCPSVFTHSQLQHRAVVPSQNPFLVAATLTTIWYAVRVVAFAPNVSKSTKGLLLGHNVQHNQHSHCLKCSDGTLYSRRRKIISPFTENSIIWRSPRFSSPYSQRGVPPGLEKEQNTNYFL